MHHHGGAYSDVKVIEDSWLPAFEDLEKSDYLINGYKIKIIKYNKYREKFVKYFFKKTKW